MPTGRLRRVVSSAGVVSFGQGSWCHVVQSHYIGPWVKATRVPFGPMAGHHGNYAGHVNPAKGRCGLCCPIIMSWTSAFEGHCCSCCGPCSCHFFKKSCPLAKWQFSIWAHVGPISGSIRTILGPCWPILEPLRAMLGLCQPHPGVKVGHA